MKKRKAHYNYNLPDKMKHTEFSETEKAIFLLGVNEGEERAKYHLELSVKTNRRLREELEAKDRTDPLVSVKLAMEDAEQIAWLLSVALEHSKSVPSEFRRSYHKQLDNLKAKLAEARIVTIELPER